MAAAVSAPPYASASLTPPSSSHGAQNAWKYSVPLENQLSTEETTDNHDIPTARQTQVTQTNGNVLLKKSSRSDLSQRRPPSRSNQLHNKAIHGRIDVANRKISPMGQQADEDHRPSTSQGGPLRVKEYGLDGADYTDEEDPEHSRWIHKDKLERMEHEEMERLGIRIPRSRPVSRSNGRSRSRGAQSRIEQQKRQQVEEMPGEQGEENSWDLRLPEERDIHDPQWEQAAGPKSASRIPVSKKSPLPIPMDFIERDLPKQYGKTTANTPSPGTDDSISYSKSRGRSGSLKALGDYNLSSTPVATPRSTSTSARRVATDISPIKKTGPRKTSAPAKTANQQRTKARSGSNSTRPGELGHGHGSGSISKRPEGDPPWLATMYKPDPRLPPDQQILPTHAKRMQQEQWEKDGKFGTTYDTSFRPLNNDDFGEKEQPRLLSPSPEVEEEQKPQLQPGMQAGWPLQSPQSPTLHSPPLPSPKSPTLSTGRPGTAGGGGSYSTMPKISSPVKSYTSPLPSPSINQTTNPLRVPEPVEEKEQEKKKEAGCGCCIVM